MSTDNTSKMTPDQEKEALLERIRGLEAKNSKLEKKTEELAEELAVKEATQGTKLPSKKVGDEFLQATGPFLFVKGRGKVPATDVLKDEKLCKELREKKSGFLRAIDPKAKKKEEKK